MVFLVFAIIAFLSLVIGAILKNKIALIASAIVLVLTIVIPVGIYSSNLGTLADLEPFYSASSSNFQISRDDTASYLSPDEMTNNALINISGSIEKMGIGAATANREQDYRNAVNIYNSSYLRFKTYSSNILYGIVYPKPPTEMRLLIINPVQNGSNNNYQTPQTTVTTPLPNIPVQSPVVTTPTSSSMSQQLQSIQDALNKLNQGK
jgi:hypothetical protein